MKPALLAAALLVLAACDGPVATVKVEANPAAETRTVTREGGTAVTTVMAGGAVTVEAELPPATPAYPGATIKTQIASASTEEGGSGRIVVMTTSDPLDKVAAFYDAKAKAAGTPASMIVTDTDSAVRMYGDGERGAGSMVAISREPGEALTEIVITAGTAFQPGGGFSPPPPPPPPPPLPGERAKVPAVVGGRLQ